MRVQPSASASGRSGSRKAPLPRRFSPKKQTVPTTPQLGSLCDCFFEIALGLGKLRCDPLGKGAHCAALSAGAGKNEIMAHVTYVDRTALEWGEQLASRDFTLGKPCRFESHAETARSHRNGKET